MGNASFRFVCEPKRREESSIISSSLNGRWTHFLWVDDGAESFNTTTTTTTTTTTIDTSSLDTDRDTKEEKAEGIGESGNTLAQSHEENITTPTTNKKRKRKTAQDEDEHYVPSKKKKQRDTSSGGGKPQLSSSSSLADIPRDPNTHEPILPLNISGMIIVSLGRVNWEHPKFHTAVCIHSFHV